MKKAWYGYHTDYKSREDALAACDVNDLDTDGMVWNGESYWDNDKKETWWPIDENEIDENGEFIQCLDRLGYKKGY